MRSLSQCNRLYTTRKGFQPYNYEFRFAWHFSTFALKTLQKTQHHQYVFARKDLVEISVRLVESILVIQIHARMGQLAHKLEVEKMTLNVPAFQASLDVFATAVFKYYIFLRKPIDQVRANIFKIYNTVSYRFTFSMKSLSEAHMIHHWKSYPIKLLLYPLHGVNHRFKFTANPPTAILWIHQI